MSKATASPRPAKPRWSGKFRVRPGSHAAMTGRDISTFLVILACVLAATALIGWLSMGANEFFLAGG